MLIRRSDISKKIAHITEQRIQLDLLGFDHLGDQIFLDQGKDRDRNGLHLVPEVLTVEFDQRHPQEMGKARLFRKALIPVHFTCRMAGSSHSGKQQGTSYGKAVSDLFRRVRKMAVDDVNDLKLFGQIEQGSHRTMTVTLDLLRDAFGQAFQQVFSPSQISQNNRPGFSIDPSGLHNTPVEMSPGSSFLKGCHIGVYNTKYGIRCQELFLKNIQYFLKIEKNHIDLKKDD